MVSITGAPPIALRKTQFAGTTAGINRTATPSPISKSTAQAGNSKMIFETLGILGLLKGFFTLLGGAFGLKWLVDKVFGNAEEAKPEKPGAKGGKKPKRKSKKP